MTLINKRGLLSAVCLCALACVAADGVAANAERIFRAPRVTRGNTNIFPVQPIDAAAWLAHPDFVQEGADVAAPRVARFRCAFTSDGSPLVFDVSADERFYLTLDGRFVARGPHRGSVDNWMYQSYRVPLAAGPHVMEAVVWKTGKAAPFAQLSHRFGFCLKAEGAYDAALTTGRGAWTCGALEGVVRPRGKGAADGWFATGDTFELTGTGLLDAQPAKWTARAGRAVLARAGSSTRSLRSGRPPPSCAPRTSREITTATAGRAGCSIPRSCRTRPKTGCARDAS